LKFGGTSVSTRERWETIAEQAKAKLKAGNRPVIVCSAVSGISNALEQLLDEAKRGEHQNTLQSIVARHRDLADELDLEVDPIIGDELETLERLALGASLTNEVSARLHARTMAMGELMSTKLGVAFLDSIGVDAVWQDARDALQAAPVGANELRHYLSATCGFEPDDELQERWGAADGDIILTQGFIARDDADDTVLLGRGGSDTSAAYFAAKLQADVLEIWTDVPGMYTANPREVPSARLLKHLDYEEAQEIATMGAKVLHPRCIDPVRRYGIPLQIRCTEAPGVEGTLITEETPDFGAQVKAISAKSGVVLVSMDTLGMWQQVGFLADAFGAFKKNGLSVDLVTTSETNVTVSLDPGANALDEQTMRGLLRDLSEFCDASQIGPCAAVSLVGENIRQILHQLGPALEAFEEQRIYLVSQAASDLNITFVVDEGQAEKLVNKLHTMIFHERVSDALLGPTWKETFEEEQHPSVAPAGAWWVSRRDQLLELADEHAAAYVYDRDTLTDRATSAMGLGADQVYYAIKANPHPDILRLFEARGLGFECVSPGELEHVLDLFDDIDRDRVLFTPNFADADEYAKGFDAGVHVTLDNLYPLEHWPEVFRGQEILVRIDPGRGKGHHEFVRTAGPRSKFGVAPAELERLRELTDELDLTIRGLHCHVGSGIRTAETWAENAVFLADVAADLGGVEILNLGGGLGVPEKPGEKPLDTAAVAAELAKFRGAHPDFEIWMEPGRYLVAEAGVLLARVTQTKRKGEIRYVGLATGMNSLIRPALYGAYHRIVNLSRLDQKTTMVADVVGPICETGDVLGHRRRLPETDGGDVFLIATAGAYGHAMSSHYNLRPPATEVLL
jgi:diaminopimelate decarboxylase/aspartate kinase